MSDTPQDEQPAGITAPEGAVDARPVPGAEVPPPGQPPVGLPNGPGVDQWGNPLTYGTGPNDVPLPEVQAPATHSQTAPAHAYEAAGVDRPEEAQQ